MKKKLGMLCVVFLLTGCSEELSYQYLVQHPHRLKKEVARCQEMQTKTRDEEKQCEVAMYAAASFMSMLKEQEEDPEKFGQRILDAEMALQKNDNAEGREELLMMLAVIGVNSPE